MESNTFTKNDQGFVCLNCGANVSPLGYTSRDHCPNCLCSIHIDIFPGDRQNTCLGKLIPTEVNQTNKKGYVITYRCEKCGQTHNNKCSTDDNFNTILKVMNKTYNAKDYQTK